MVLQAVASRLMSDGIVNHDFAVLTNVNDDFTYLAFFVVLGFGSRNGDVHVVLETRKLPRHDEENEQQENHVHHRSQLELGGVLHSVITKFHRFVGLAFERKMSLFRSCEFAGVRAVTTS